MTILKNFWLLDAHCDSLWMRDFIGDDLNLNKTKFKLSQQTKDFFKNTLNVNFPKNYVHSYHINLSRLRKGNVKALVLNLGDFDLLQSSRLIDAAYKLSNDFVICKSYQEITQTIKNNKIAIIICIEGPCIFEGQIDLLKNWQKLGLKVVSLTHGEGTDGLPKNPKSYYGKKSKTMAQHALQISTSLEVIMTATQRKTLYKKEKGLTNFGLQVLKEMTSLKMICDLSHANDAAFWEVLESGVKVCVTHSNCFTLCNHTRNLTDEMMKALAQRNGVLGVCFFGEYVDPIKPSLDKYIAHIFHALEIMGQDHVAIGSDYDGVPPDAYMVIKNPSYMDNLWNKLLQQNLSETLIRKIAHENFLNLLE